MRYTNLIARQRDSSTQHRSADLLCVLGFVHWVYCSMWLLYDALGVLFYFAIFSPQELIVVLLVSVKRTDNYICPGE